MEEVILNELWDPQQSEYVLEKSKLTFNKDTGLTSHDASKTSNNNRKPQNLTF